MPKKVKRILEKDILASICEDLTKKDLLFWRSNNIPVFGRSNDGNFRFRAMPKYGRRGVPDILIVNKGKFIGVEVKMPKKELRPDQGDFGMELTLNGGMYCVAHSLEEFKSFPFYSDFDNK